MNSNCDLKLTLGEACCAPGTRPLEGYGIPELMAPLGVPLAADLNHKCLARLVKTCENGPISALPRPFFTVAEAQLDAVAFPGGPLEL